MLLKIVECAYRSWGIGGSSDGVSYAFLLSPHAQKDLDWLLALDELDLRLVHIAIFFLLLKFSIGICLHVCFCLH